MKRKTLLDILGFKFFIAYFVLLIGPIVIALIFEHPEIAMYHLFIEGPALTIFLMAELIWDDIIKTKEREALRRDTDILLESIHHNQEIIKHYIDDINKHLG